MTNPPSLTPTIPLSALSSPSAQRLPWGLIDAEGQYAKNKRAEAPSMEVRGVPQGFCWQQLAFCSKQWEKTKCKGCCQCHASGDCEGQARITPVVMAVFTNYVHLTICGNLPATTGPITKVPAHQRRRAAADSGEYRQAAGLTSRLNDEGSFWQVVALKSDGVKPPALVGDLIKCQRQKSRRPPRFRYSAKTGRDSF